MLSSQIFRVNFWPLGHHLQCTGCNACAVRTYKSREPPYSSDCTHNNLPLAHQGADICKVDWIVFDLALVDLIKICQIVWYRNLAKFCCNDKKRSCEQNMIMNVIFIYPKSFCYPICNYLSKSHFLLGVGRSIKTRN